jgi:uncharacterized protein DUF6745
MPPKRADPSPISRVPDFIQQAEAILTRLEAIDRRCPVIDRSAAEKAIDAHFTALGLNVGEVAWSTDVEDAYDTGARAARAAREAHEARAAWEAWAAWASRTGQDAREVQEARAAWDVWEGREGALHAREAREARVGSATREGWAARAPLATLAWEEREALAWLWRSVCSVERYALIAADWLWWREYFDSPAIERYASIVLPLVDAALAGLFEFVWTPHGTIAIPRPAIQTDSEDRLHHDDGPAISWPSGRNYWYWHDVQVSQRVIEAPETLTQAEILGEPNVEVRRVMIERFGAERLLREAKARRVHADKFGKLWELDIPGDEPLCMVELISSTAAVDGSRRTYFLRVPPDVLTAHEAVAWTFDLEPDEYRVLAET